MMIEAAIEKFILETGFFIFLGLLGLWLGSNLIIKGAIKLSHSLGLSQTFIGLTVVALGTSFPEIMVALTAASQYLEGQRTADIVLGNIIGSSMMQISFILGLAGLLKVMKFAKKQIFHNGLMLVLAAFLLLLVSMDGQISRADGVVFLLCYIIYLVTLKKQTLISKIKAKVEKNHFHSILAIVQLFIGLFILSESGQLVVTNSLKIAEELGVSQLMIGIILLGLGTSLPELVVSITAVIHGSNGLSVGNLLGSLIVNIFVALGLSSVIANWQLTSNVVQFDMPYLLLTCVIVVLFLLTRKTLERKESLLLIALYAVFIALKFLGW